MTIRWFADADRDEQAGILRERLERDELLLTFARWLADRAGPDGPVNVPELTPETEARLLRLLRGTGCLRHPPERASGGGNRPALHGCPLVGRLRDTGRFAAKLGFRRTMVLAHGDLRDLAAMTLRDIATLSDALSGGGRDCIRAGRRGVS